MDSSHARRVSANSPLGLSCAALVLLGMACDAGVPQDESMPPPPASVWARSHTPGAPGSNGFAVPWPPNEGALSEILARVPEAHRDSTGPDGGSLIGSKTDVPEGDAPPDDVVVELRPQAVVKLGVPEKQPGLSSAGIERALRAGFYYELVQRCRARDGSILPPEAIKLQFTVAADGTIAPSTIVATALADEHRDAASCMRRALGAVSFRGPSSARGQTTDVTALVPSVD